MSAARDVARAVIRDEAEALRQLADGLPDDFLSVIEALRGCRQVIVSGIGKSGAVAQKIAASLSSTGSPAVFMHPVEALHGDLGIVGASDGLIALSRSGNTEELVRFVAHFKRLGGPVIALTQARDSRLSAYATHTLLLPDLPEAGPLNLAPTTSCVTQLAAGDAIAMALLHLRGFRADDFAQYHPEGALGRRLLLRARDLMHTGDELPRVPADETVRALMVEMTEKRLGLALILEADGRLLGTFTDGDLRRLLERVDNPLTLDARGAYQHSRRTADLPRVIRSVVPPEHPAVDCLRIMRDGRITSLVVMEHERPVGVLRMMDLIDAGL